MEDQFKIGDLVKLKSGGPAMTVRELRADEEVLCEWFDKNVYSKEIFHQAQLRELKDSDSPITIIPRSRNSKHHY